MIRDKYEDLHLKPLFGPIVLSRRPSTANLQVPVAVKIPQRGRPLLISKSSSNLQRRGVLRVSSSSPFPQASRSLSPGSSISYGSSVDSTQRRMAHIRLQLRPSDESPSMAMLLRVSSATTPYLLPRKICLGQSRYRCTPKVPPCHVHRHPSNGSTLFPS
jgi:hypothetical protein